MKHFIIAIGREFGSGGSEIGRILAENLGVKCYNRSIIDMAVEKTGLVKESLAKEDESMTVLKKSILSISNSGTPLIADELMTAEAEIIRQLAASESCVIVGRCADYVLEDRDDVLNVFLWAPDDYKIERIMDEFDLERREAARLMRKKSSQRAGYYKYVTGDEMGNNKRNHILINSASFGGSRETAALIEAAVKVRFAD